MSIKIRGWFGGRVGCSDKYGVVMHEFREMIMPVAGLVLGAPSSGQSQVEGRGARFFRIY
jgi:hypothetical protein